MTDPDFALTFRNDVRHTILVLSSSMHAGPTGSFEAGERAQLRFEFDAWIAPSSYTVTASVLHDGRPVAEFADAFTLGLRAERSSGGVVDLPAQFEVLRA
jgi:hypothetical protein